MQINNFASRHTCSQLLCQEKRRRKKKRKEAAAMCQDITRYTKKAKHVGVVGDDTLTGPVVAGRLEKRTASTTDDSASLSGSVFEVPCNTVVVADERETEHSPIFCFPYHIAIREMHQGHCCPVKRVSMTYLRIHLHHHLFQS